MPAALAAARAAPAEAVRVVRLSLLESRPVVLFSFALRLLAGACLAGAWGHLRPARLVATLVVWECAVVFVYLYNGITDRVGDRSNGSSRPIASGRLGTAPARTVALAAAAAALAGALPLGGARLEGCVIALLLLGYLYSGGPVPLKRQPVGAAVTAGLGGLLSYAAGYTTGARAQVSPAFLVLAVSMSLWMGTVGTTSKDLPDVHGDLLDGRRTLPIVWGERRARCAVAVLAIAVAAGFLVASLLAAPGLLPAAGVVLAGALLLAAAAYRTVAPGRADRPDLLYRIFVVTQHCAHLAVLSAYCAAAIF